MTEPTPREEHLAAGDFFRLALPSAGEPEPLPPHLSVCAACARQLSEWRGAARQLSSVDDEPPAGFEARVMERVRAMKTPRSRRSPRRWLAGLSAAACLLAAFWLGTRAASPPPAAAPPGSVSSTSSMTAADRADDELLRDVSRLVSSEDETSWKALAPLPPAPGGNS